MNEPHEVCKGDLPIVPIARSCTHIVIRWGLPQSPQSRELGSLEALRLWEACHRDEQIHTLHYRCFDVSGQVGTFVYNGISSDDDGWWVCMIIENAKNAIDDLFKALREREKSIRPVKRRAHRRVVALAA